MYYFYKVNIKGEEKDENSGVFECNGDPVQAFQALVKEISNDYPDKDITIADFRVLEYKGRTSQIMR